MATFRKRGSSWEVQIRRQGHQTITRSFTSKADARIWARQIEARIDRSELPHRYRKSQRLTLGDLLRRYRDEVTPRKRSSRQESCRLARLLSHPMAAVPLGKLTPGLFATFRDDRLKGVQSQTVRHDLNLIGRAITVARMEWEAPIESNPVALVAKPSPAKARQRRVAEAELEMLERAAVQLDPLSAIVRFAIETAMRKGEILRSRWDHIDLQRRLLFIPLTKNGHARTIPLTYRALDILTALPRDTENVFPVSTAWLRFAWDKTIKVAELSDLHFHDLRHEAISRFFERGLSVPEVALISGHRDVRQLFRYTHLKAEDVAQKLA